jgi:hypothetical protein
MLRLKGVKLPAAGVVVTKYANYGRKALVVANNNVGSILADIHEEYTIDEALDDIITGVVRSFTTADSHKGSKLNIAVVRSMLHKLPTISQLSIMDNYGYGRQQASKYAQACRLVIQFKDQHVVRCALNSLSKYAE